MNRGLSIIFLFLWQQSEHLAIFDQAVGVLLSIMLCLSIKLPRSSKQKVASIHLDYITELLPYGKRNQTLLVNCH